MTVGYKTGGRQKGTRNKRTLEIERRVEDSLREFHKKQHISKTSLELVAEAKQAAKQAGVFEGYPDMFLMHVYRDPVYPIDTRVRAATNVLPYLKPKIEAVSVYSQAEKNGQTNDISRLELARRVAYLLTTAVKGKPGETLELLGRDTVDVGTNMGTEEQPITEPSNTKGSKPE